MEVTTIESTDAPERVTCMAARGDYFDGFIGDTDFDEVMEGVQYDDGDVDAVHEIFNVRDDETEAEYRGSFTRIAAVDDHPDLPDVETLYRQHALLDDLAASGHWGPFEHPQITFGVKGVSRVTMAQITRHRHVSFDVQSMRYVDFSNKEQPYAVPASITDDDHFARETGQVDLEDVDEEYVEESYRDLAEQAFDWYERMVEHGMPKEDARFILPLGSKVNLSASMNARMFLHVEDMRGKGGGDAQWEIRDMTEGMREEFEEWMPMTAHIYDRRGPHKLAP